MKYFIILKGRVIYRWCLWLILEANVSTCTKLFLFLNLWRICKKRHKKKSNFADATSQYCRMFLQLFMFGQLVVFCEFLVLKVWERRFVKSKKYPASCGMSSKQFQLRLQEVNTVSTDGISDKRRMTDAGEMVPHCLVKQQHSLLCQKIRNKKDRRSGIPKLVQTRDDLKN